MNPEDVTKTAVTVGQMDQQAADAATKAVEAANSDTGVRPDELKGTKTFLLQVLVDNSGSMEGFEEPVYTAFGDFLDQLTEAQGEAVGTDILISVSLLHGGQIQPYCPIADCVRLSPENFRCKDDTPLLTRANELLGTLLVKIDELAQSGRTVLTYTVFITDGGATDEAKIDVSDIAQTVLGLTETKRNIVCAISIGNAADESLLAMGIKKKWILDPEKDPFGFENALREVSRASRSASRGAGKAFQSVADEGFRAVSFR